MYRCYSFLWLVAILLVCIFLTVPAEGDISCSKECKKISGRYSVGKTYGPPKFKFSITRKDVSFSNRLVKIECPLCQSNPPSTLTWFFNERPLNSKKNQARITKSCGENLLVKIASERDVGNYTCVARNSRGNATKTTLVLREDAYSSSKENIKLEGSVNENEVKIGSTINITCAHDFDCGIKWTKDGKTLQETADKRIQWIHYEPKFHKFLKHCKGKLVIRNVTANDTGTYGCVGFPKVGTHRTEKNPVLSIEIHAVPCFLGYYCPLNATTAKRCPRGTFSQYNNATSVTHCQFCPTHGRDEFKLGLKKRDRTAAAIFSKNCPDVETPGKMSSLSKGQKIAVGISTFVFFILMAVPILFGWRRSWKKSKDFQEKLFGPPKDVEIEIPETPLSNDVFICYSSKNFQWVHDILLANLNKQNFNSFIDFNDFEAGLAICDNIVNAIYGSRKTIFVLSNDSLKSFYARVELRQALAAGRTGHQVIVLMYEKCKIPSEIAHIVYLDWTDEKNRDRFWEKLYSAIRRPLPYEANS